MVNPVMIKAGGMEAKISPEGGSILSLHFKKGDKNIDLLKSSDGKTPAMFPMIPYANRIRGGAFVYFGIKRSLPQTDKKVPDPIHGDGWMTKWEVSEQTEKSVTLSYNHEKGKGGFPLPYAAEQTFSIHDKKLSIKLKATNTGDLPMPVGLGFHPYFKRTSDVKLQFRNRTVWANEALPPRNRPYKTPAEWSFEEKKALGKLNCDLCFGNYDGTAVIEYPSEGFAVRMETKPETNHIMLFAPSGSDYFCLEPATQTTDAFNLASQGVIGTGIQTLEPGEHFQIFLDMILEA